MLKRGFKSQCERRSVELRRQLNLTDIDPLDAAAVAEKFGVIVWSPSDVIALPEVDRLHLLGTGRSEWSGFTLRTEDRHLVVLNTAQSKPRQNSVLMHELAHIILGHELVTGTITGEGHFIASTYGQNQEDEAAWFGATLLIPRPALVWMRRQRMSDNEATVHFGVSLDLLHWRVRMTGVDFQLGLKTTTKRRA